MFSRNFIFRFFSIWSALLFGMSVPRSIERQCLLTYPKECSSFFRGTEVAPSGSLQQYSIFPNARNLLLTDALREFGDFNRLLSLNNYCSYLLYSFLCIHYFSPCDPESNSNVFVVPCRAMCEEAAVECLDYVFNDYLNISRPHHLNCANFPVESSDSENDLVACPSPGKITLAHLHYRKISDCLSSYSHHLGPISRTPQ